MNEEINAQASVSEAQNQETEAVPTSSETVGERAVDDETDLCDPAKEDPHPDPSTAAQDAPSERIGALEAELATVKAQLAERLSEDARVREEYNEFQRLYPEVRLQVLPDEVWEDISKKVPLAAAYALAERRHLMRRQNAERVNLQNEQRSAGSVKGSENSYYTPAEVRSMSQAEVRKNYSKIIESMKKWN